MPTKISGTAAPLLHDLAWAVHLHSHLLDGTGTVAQIVSAELRAGADVVMPTDTERRLRTEVLTLHAAA
jgi:hypothetical protein